jgi:hypothetical protein
VINHLIDLQIEIDLLGGSHRDLYRKIRVLRAALAAGLRSPAGFYLTIEDVLQAYERAVAWREMWFGKGA